MLISRSKKFLFIHIQKTAGRSFEAVLKEHIPDLESYRGTHDHALWAKDELGDEWSDYYKVAFVRNPWDRLVSWYTMIREKGTMTLYKKVFGARRYNDLTQYVLANADSFEDFLYKCRDTIDDIDGRKSILYNQLDYVSDEKGDLLVDFVGRFEDLANDSQVVFDGLGLENVSLPHKNSSKHKNYRTYYTDETKEEVSKMYSKDISYFGYEF
ncbi:MAG: sulfotransferase family 2 domain-containing protein [Thermodesulfobacteriota bacterium]